MSLNCNSWSLQDIAKNAFMCIGLGTHIHMWYTSKLFPTISCISLIYIYIIQLFILVTLFKNSLVIRETVNLFISPLVRKL